MSGAACAKIVLDSYGSYGGAAWEAAELSKAACDSMMQLYEDPSLSKEERDEIIKLSELECKWGDEMREWNKHIRDTIRTIAERHIKSAASDGG
jgi:hypothetical protein